MGRGGGGGGSSHSSGGGSFHYGSSRGGGSSSRGGGSSSRGSSGNSYRSNHNSYGGYRPPYRGPRYGSRTVIHTHSSSWLIGLIWFGIILAIIVGNVLSKSPVPASTQMRTKLPAADCKVIDTWYEDELDWIHDEAELKRGLKDFYNATGVQPYLYITDNINGKSKPTASDFENYLGHKYDDLFGEDAGHLLVCFMESSPSTYATYYIPGTKAKTVIDEEAGSILLSYIDYNYTSDMSDEEMFASSFRSAASRMMTVSQNHRTTVVKVAGIILLATLALFAAYFVNRALKNKRLQAEADAKILNAPLETDDDDSLLDKYDK